MSMLVKQLFTETLLFVNLASTHRFIRYGDKQTIHDCFGKYLTTLWRNTIGNP